MIRNSTKTEVGGGGGWGDHREEGISFQKAKWAEWHVEEGEVGQWPWLIGVPKGSS